MIIRALVLLAVARVSLAILGFATTRALFRTFSRIPANAIQLNDVPALINQSVHVAGRHALFATTCLPRSLVMWTLLRRHGFDATLRLGARRTDGRFEAHAWVELGSILLDPTGDETDAFVPFPCTSLW